MHTEATLAWLEQVTTDLGHLMWDFQDKTCTKFNTTELACKAKAQNCHNAGEKSMKAPNQSHKVKTLNLLTYKFHAFGDYVHTICMFGTTDSFSMQLVCAVPYAYASQVYQSPYCFQGETAHRVVKHFYGLTNKHSVTKQIGA